jgi:hypothetical protein
MTSSTGHPRPDPQVTHDLCIQDASRGRQLGRPVVNTTAADGCEPGGQHVGNESWIELVEESVEAEIVAGDVEQLAVMFVWLSRSSRRLKHCTQAVEERLAEVMESKTLELEGLPVLERRNSTLRKRWESDALLDRVVRYALDPEGDGSLPMTPFEAVSRVVASVKDAIPVTPSLGWRVGALRAIGLDPDEWCETEPGPTKVQIHEGSR